MLLSFCYIYKDFVRQLKEFPPSFSHFCACEMSLGWGHLITWMDPSVRHLNGILARVGGNLNNKSNARRVARWGGGGLGHVEALIWPIHYFDGNVICPCKICKDARYCIYPCVMCTNCNPTNFFLSLQKSTLQDYNRRNVWHIWQIWRHPTDKNVCRCTCIICSRYFVKGATCMPCLG